MSDLFHNEAVPVRFIEQVFEVMAATPQHTYQVLTKRAKRLSKLAKSLEWPSNAWMGVSVENDRYAFRARHLEQVPAAVRFLSCEPLLGPVPSLDLGGPRWDRLGDPWWRERTPRSPGGPDVGARSARPMQRSRHPLLREAARIAMVGMPRAWPHSWRRLGAVAGRSPVARDASTASSERVAAQLRGTGSWCPQGR